MERPALMEILDDIKAGKIHIVVVYKIDRLTRSLMDFAKLVEVFDQYGVTFVSVTQSFNTTTSMGRLTLNVLLSFAQFEREVAGERIRDKIAASKKRGMFMGGVPPLGYRVENRQLLVDSQNARITKHIFERYLALGSTIALANELKAQGIKSPVRTSEKGVRYGGAVFSRGAIHQILTNPMYIGKIRHRHETYEGQHQGIIPVEIWEEVQNRLQNQAVTARKTKKASDENLLRGRLFDVEGHPYRPVFTNKGGKRYRYYACDAGGKLPSYEVETLVVRTIKDRLSISRNAADFLGLNEDLDCHLLEKIVQCQSFIPVGDLLRTAVKKVVIDAHKVVVHINIENLSKLLSDHVKISLPEGIPKPEKEISAPYLRNLGPRGAVVIQPSDARKDILDLPPEKLKKLVQGLIWQKEHFSGVTVKEIANREMCSESYAGTAIISGFDILQAAPPDFLS